MLRNATLSGDSCTFLVRLGVPPAVTEPLVRDTTSWASASFAKLPLGPGPFTLGPGRLGGLRVALRTIKTPSYRALNEH